MVNQIQLHPTAIATASTPKPATRNQATDFASVLTKELHRSQAVRFSAHALRRLEQRGINLSPDELAQIDDAVNQVAAKGAKESLLVMDRVALVVSVANRTVITALSANEMENTVFTHIDSAILVPKGSTPDPQTNNRPDPERGGLDVADRPTRHI